MKRHWLKDLQQYDIVAVGLQECKIAKYRNELIKTFTDEGFIRVSDSFEQGETIIEDKDDIN